MLGKIISLYFKSIIIVKMDYPHPHTAHPTSIYPQTQTNSHPHQNSTPTPTTPLSLTHTHIHTHFYNRPDESIPRCMMCANFVIPVLIYGKLSANNPNFLGKVWIKTSKWPSGSWSLASTFNTVRNIFGANLVILHQIRYTSLRGQVELPKILSRNGQMTLKVNVNDPIFNIS